MNWEVWITIGSTLLTVIATVVTIASARLTKSYRDQVKFDIRKINLAGAIDHLRRSQDEIRKLPTTSDGIPRGLKVKDVIKEIRARFDNAIGIMASAGPDSDIRAILTEAQEELNGYEVSFDAKALDAQRVYRLQALMQDAVSTANSRIFQLEGKA